MATELFIL